MNEPLRLMCILAHPDDESMGLGSALARYAAEGVEISLVTATRGERGWQSRDEPDPGPEALAAIRTAELQAAARCLGVRGVDFLGYVDGNLDQADPAEAIRRIAALVRRDRPQVVVTFGPDGAYGHPDHIAISQFALAAVVAAANAGYDGAGLAPHAVAKFYYMADTREDFEVWKAAGVDFGMVVDGVQRKAAGWEPWAVTTFIDGDAYWRTAWQAIQCHRSQLVSLPDLAALMEERHRELMGVHAFYRAFSRVNGGRAVENDLFAGLR